MRERFIILAIAVVVGAIGVFLVGQYLQKREQELEARYAAFRDVAQVLVATEDIPAETVLASSMVESKPIPELFIQPYATSDPRAVTGKITAAPMAKGEQVLTNKLGIPGSRKTLSVKMEPGKRALTIAVDAISSVGGFLQPGDRVDMLGIFSIPAPQGQQALTVTLLQHVLVLAVGQEVIDQPPSRAKTSGTTDGPATVTVALSPQEIELVLFAREQGKLQLSLRPRADKELVQLQPFTMNSLVAMINPGGVPQQEPEKPPQKEVEVYRGLKREVVVVP